MLVKGIPEDQNAAGKLYSPKEGREYAMYLLYHRPADDPEEQGNLTIRGNYIGLVAANYSVVISQRLKCLV